ncbi:MAG: patatin-like phospholipase family protein [Balneolia bacterium]|nr:patatin-like phospholipase family protein [Balneolia bacterium]
MKNHLPPILTKAVTIALFALSLAAFNPSDLIASNAVTYDSLESNFPEITSETKLGLTLSGGGAKGFAHLGILKVLEEVGMPIDYITGTSMGALVGGLYAMGYSIEFIENLAFSLDWDDLFSDEIRRRHIPMEEKDWDSVYLVTLPIIEKSIGLPSGVVAGQRIEMLLNQLTWPYPGHQDFMDFPIPFACVATDLETGEAVVFTEGFPAEAIRASISIPSVFMPKRVDGRILIDGGVVRNLPVEEALELGSDIVIGVNVSSPLMGADEIFNILDIMDQTVSFQISKNIHRSMELTDIMMVDHDIFDFNILDFDKAKDIVDKGEELARMYYDELKELADQLNEARGTLPTYPAIAERENMIYMSQIEILGVDDGSENQVKSKLMLEPGTYITLEDITLGIENIYGLQFYNSVSYKLLNDEDFEGAYILQVEVLERQLDLFRFGFNYDNLRRASILLNTTFRNLLYPNSVTRLNVKLGEEPYVDARFFNYLTNESNFALSMRLNYSLYRIDTFNTAGDRISSFNTNSVFLEAMAVPFVNNKIQFSMGVRQEFFDITTRVGELDFPFGSTSISQLIARMNYDNLDRLNFTQRGHKIDLEASQSVDVFDTSINYFQARFLWNGHIQLSDPLVMLLGSKIGYATSDLPLHRQFHLGGYPDFVGYQLYELGSSNVRVAQLGFQYRIFSDYYLSTRGNIASTEALDEIDFANTPLRIGWSIGAGWDSRIAPFRVSFMGSKRNPIMIYYSVGVRF